METLETILTQDDVESLIRRQGLLLADVEQFHAPDMQSIMDDYVADKRTSIKSNKSLTSSSGMTNGQARDSPKHLPVCFDQSIHHVFQHQKSTGGSAAFTASSDSAFHAFTTSADASDDPFVNSDPFAETGDGSGGGDPFTNGGGNRAADTAEAFAATMVSWVFSRMVDAELPV